MHRWVRDWWWSICLFRRGGGDWTIVDLGSKPNCTYLFILLVLTCWTCDWRERCLRTGTGEEPKPLVSGPTLNWTAAATRFFYLTTNYVFTYVVYIYLCMYIFMYVCSYLEAKLPIHHFCPNKHFDAINLPLLPKLTLWSSQSTTLPKLILPRYQSTTSAETNTLTLTINQSTTFTKTNILTLSIHYFCQN